MGELHSPFELCRAGPERIAKDILDVLVRELKFRPGDFLYESALVIAFKVNGLTVKDTTAGLAYARQQGWLIFDPDLQAYELTRAGFATV